MRAKDASIATPVLTPEMEAQIEQDDIYDFSSGYIQRSKHLQPKNGVNYPWRLNQEYVADRKLMAKDPVDDGILSFTAPSANAQMADEHLEAAE